MEPQTVECILDTQKMLEGIRGSEKERSKVVGLLYQDRQLRQSIRSYILNHQGSEDDVNMIFNDVIVQFIKSAFSNRDLQIHVELHAYLMGITKHLWYAVLKQRSKELKVESLENREFSMTDNESLGNLLSEEKQSLLHQILATLGKNCREVLMYWAHGYSMEEISDRMVYKSGGMARKKKSHCMKELLGLLEQNPKLKMALSV